MTTKKWMLLFGFLLATNLNLSLQAQGVGFKVGLSVSNLQGEIPTKSRFDAAVGFYADLDYNDRLSFQVEAVLNRIGATARATEQEFRLHYIAVPILVKYDVLDRVSLYAGPQISFLSTAQTYINEEIFDVNDAVNSSDFGLAAGFTFQFPSSLNIDIRVYQGMIKVYKNALLNPVLKNQVFTVSIGYLLAK
ncbi:MAG: porin family protein [Saprospiraceae bacterium]